MKILIIGDAGAGKSTLAKQLESQLEIPVYSTDDFLWVKKFSIKAEVNESVDKIKQVYGSNNWIVEGTTNYLVEPGFEPSDRIIYLGFTGIFSQWRALIKRHYIRRDESWKHTILLMRHVLYKRYKWGYKKNDPTILEMVKPFEHKLAVVQSRSAKENLSKVQMYLPTNKN